MDFTIKIAIAPKTWMLMLLLLLELLYSLLSLCPCLGPLLHYCRLLL